MKELIGFVMDKSPGEVVIGLPSGMRRAFKTSSPLYLGQKVWVAYDFTKNKIASISGRASQEASPPNNLPDPVSLGCSVEETHPIVEEETYIEVEDIEEGFYGSD